MSLIVSPNLTVDRTVRLERLEPGAVLRPERAVVTAGAKGVNVARVLSTLGDPSSLVGFVPTDDEESTARLFAREPVELVGVPVAGALRVATIYLEADGRTTVLNEPGPDIDEAAWSRLCETVRTTLAASDAATLVCAGSLPPGAPIDGYAQLAAIGRDGHVEVVVDAAREVLSAALAAAPDLVTPNLAEAETVLGGTPVDDVADDGPDVPYRAVQAATKLVGLGARRAAVTAGALGVGFASDEGAGWLPGVPVDVVNSVGAGDSFVGGYVRAREQGHTPVDAMMQGIGAASASCEQLLAGGVDPGRARTLAERVVQLVELERGEQP